VKLLSHKQIILSSMKSAYLYPHKIKLLFVDFDGTMTDNKVLISECGIEHVVCNRSDGWGIRLLKEQNVEVICISSEKNPVVRKRCEKLEVQCMDGVNTKGEQIINTCNDKNIPLINVAFIGNDLNDISALKVVGLPIVVNDANSLTKDFAKLVLNKKGGEGVILELVEILFPFHKSPDVYHK
jgi:3-deoxy-D-manno-octulosonate 8-phosphate phosphatase (KDO 8-P phosphatase)